jgi:hypothetical protein
MLHNGYRVLSKSIFNVLPSIIKSPRVRSNVKVTFVCPSSRDEALTELTLMFVVLGFIEYWKVYW